MKNSAHSVSSMLNPPRRSQNDPWLFGHFSDNELTFTEKGIVKEYLKHPPNDPNHKAAKKFMAERGGGSPTRRMTVIFSS